MKIFRIFGFEIKIHFSFEKYKRIEVSIPDWADDAHLRHIDSNDSDDKYKVCYYKGSTPYYIDIPKHKKAIEISVTRLYNKERTDYEKNRKVIIDLYF
jgi:hypothetical protein